jgi:ATP-dependent RNA helicase DHX36
LDLISLNLIIDVSDHIAIIKAYNGWQEAKHNGEERSYCWKNYLSLSTLRKMEEMSQQFINILADINIVDKFQNIKVTSQFWY